MWIRSMVTIYRILMCPKMDMATPEMLRELNQSHLESIKSYAKVNIEIRGVDEETVK